MRAPSKILMIAAMAVVTALTACGGSSDSPPGPLARHFDDMYIATIAPGQKPQVVQTQQDWSVARMENAKAEADYNESATQLSIAQNDQKAAHLGVDSAVSAKKAAEASADTNRVNQATRDLHTAEDVAKAADARVKYVEAYRNYLKVAMRHAQENMYWREAQYEVAKAQVGQSNNIAPKGLSYDAFPQQEQDRSKRTSAAKDRLDAEKQRVMSARDNWRKAQEVADRETGRPANFSDPMATKPGTTGSSQ
jgi:colicin import membrane protein